MWPLWLGKQICCSLLELVVSGCELAGRRVRMVSLQPGLLASEEGVVPSVRACTSALSPKGSWWHSWVGGLNTWGQSLVNLPWFQGDISAISGEDPVACYLLVCTSFSHIWILWEKPQGFPYTSFHLPVCCCSCKQCKRGCLGRPQLCLLELFFSLAEVSKCNLSEQKTCISNSSGHFSFWEWREWVQLYIFMESRFKLLLKWGLRRKCLYIYGGKKRILLDSSLR